MAWHLIGLLLQLAGTLDNSWQLLLPVVMAFTDDSCKPEVNNLIDSLMRDATEPTRNSLENAAVTYHPWAHPPP